MWRCQRNFNVLAQMKGHSSFSPSSFHHLCSTTLQHARYSIISQDIQNSIPGAYSSYHARDEDSDLSPYTADPWLNPRERSLTVFPYWCNSDTVWAVYVWTTRTIHGRRGAFVAFLNILTLWSLPRAIDFLLFYVSAGHRLQTILEIVRAWIVFINGEAWVSLCSTFSGSVLTYKLVSAQAPSVVLYDKSCQRAS